jgi:hypothetical protein
MIVTISKDVRRRVDEQVVKMTATALKEQLPDYNNTTNVDMSELISRLSMYPHVDLYDKIPKGWLDLFGEEERLIVITKKIFVPKSTEYYLSNDYTASELRRLLAREKEGVRWDKPPSRDNHRYTHIQDFLHAPASHAAYSRPCSAVADNRLSTPQITVAMFESIRQAYPQLPGVTELSRHIELMDEAEQIRDRWEKIQADVSKLLDTYKTVNQIIKVVPQFRAYVPQDIVGRVDTKPKKSERTTIELPDVDTSTLAAEGAIFRMTGEGK